MIHLLVIALVFNRAASSTINCHGNCDCSSSPAGELCVLNCNGKDVCKDSVLQCGSGHECTVNCIGEQSCGGDTTIYGQGSTHFKLNCQGKDACKGDTVIDCGSESCSVQCSASTSCEEATINVLSTKQFECLGNCHGVNAPPPFAMPTPKPTASPEPSPTKAPTAVPTSKPLTRAPTSKPSVPSVQPTQASATPTVSPTTNAPTSAPSTNPSQSPTESPTPATTVRTMNDQDADEQDSEEEPDNNGQSETVVTLSTAATTTTNTDSDTSTEEPLRVAMTETAKTDHASSTYNALMISGIVLISVSMLFCTLFYLYSKKRHTWFNLGMRKNKIENDLEMQRMHQQMSKSNAQSMAAMTPMALCAVESSSSEKSAPTTDGVRRDEWTVPRKPELIDSNSIFSQDVRQMRVEPDVVREVDGIANNLVHTNMLELQCEPEPKSAAHAHAHGHENDSSSDSDCVTKLSSCTKSTASRYMAAEGAEAALPNSTNFAVAYAQAEAACGVASMHAFSPKKSAYMALPQRHHYPALPVSNDMYHHTGAYYYQHVATTNMPAAEARPFIDDHRGSTTTLNSLPRDTVKRMPHTFDEENVEHGIMEDEEVAVQSKLLFNAGR